MTLLTTFKFPKITQYSHLGHVYFSKSARGYQSDTGRVPNIGEGSYL